MKKVYVDQRECVGCELCTHICNAFQMNDQNKSEIAAHTIEGLEEKIQEAIDNCPAMCIHWQEA